MDVLPYVKVTCARKTPPTWSCGNICQAPGGYDSETNHVTLIITGHWMSVYLRQHVRLSLYI